MSIKYSCFISYAHSQSNIVIEFMEQLKQALKDSLGAYLREGVYMDERLTPGDSFNEGIAKAICESAVMIVVYSPLYERSKYCLREFLAMEKIEEKRKELLKEKYNKTKRMIIPLILRGDINNLPSKIQNIHCYDFSQFKLATLKITEKDIDVIEEIAEMIHKHYTDLENISSNELNDGCNEFMLPSEEEVENLWSKSNTSSRFPGRNTT